MDGLKIQAKDFDTRSQIDRYVSLECGENAEANRSAGHSISGTRDELRRLGLSQDVRVHGVKVVLLEDKKKK